jgi:hypothetical protein
MRQSAALRRSERLGVGHVAEATPAGQVVGAALEARSALVLSACLGGLSAPFVSSVAWRAVRLM